MSHWNALSRGDACRAAAVFVAVTVLGLIGPADTALAACSISGTPGVAVDCSGASVLPTTGIPGVSIIDGSTSPQIGVRLTTDGTSLQNATTITSQVTNPTGRNTFNVFGIATTGIDDSTWFVLNNGSVTAVHNGVGQLAAIGFLGNNGEVGVVNNGLLQISRGSITLATNTASSLTATSSGGGPSNLGNAAAIWVQEEENEELSVTNNGTIAASGKLTSGIFTRGAFAEIENAAGAQITATGAGSLAIGAHNGTDQEDEGGFHNFFIGNTVVENEGAIIGDVQIVDANGLRWAASRLSEGGGPYDPLNITSQAGRRDSTIINSGAITGNIYLGGGNHVFSNTAEGSVTGNIDVDQRRNFNYTVNNPSSLPLRVFRAGEDEPDDEGNPPKVFNSVAEFLAAYPDHYFNFDNAGPLYGNLSVHTNVTGGPDHTSTVLLQPHINAVGAGSSFNSPSTNIGFISGTLAVGVDGTTPNGRNITVSTIATTTTVNPVLDHFVRNGDWYLVAGTLYGDALPQLAPEDSFLVDFDLAKNGNGSLVLGTSVVDATTIPNLSRAGANTLNALLESSSTDPQLNQLGLAFERLTTAGQVRTAAEQLKPEVNGAQIQVPFLFSSLVIDRINNRLVQFQGGNPALSAHGFPEPERLAPASAPTVTAISPQVFDEDDPTTYGYRPNAGWGQFVGSRIEQGAVGDVSGYDAGLWGLVFGYDGKINSSTRAGAAFGYSNTNIDDTGVMSANNTVINSYLGVIYGMWKPGPWYVNGTLGLGTHRYQTKRVLSSLQVASAEDEGGGEDETDESVELITPNAQAEFSGMQGMVNIDGGYPLQVGSSIFIPVASLTYNVLDESGYTETGDGGMALRVRDNTTDSLRSGLGARLLVPVFTNSVAEFRAVWQHEFLDTAQVVTASFLAGSGSFVAPGPQPERDTADLGAGLVIRTGNGMGSLTLDYDATLMDSFVAHTGLARLRVNFF